MKNSFDVSVLEEKIGYDFKDKTILRKALTHSSYSNESGVKNHHLLCNERLEFLGDSVLSLICSEYLYKNFSDCPEGELTRLRSETVCERALSTYSEKIELGKYLYLGVGEEKNNGRGRRSILADAFEALLAAIYIDAGDNGMDNAKKFLMPFITDEINRLRISGFYADAKTLLQQFVQQAEGDFLEYVTTGERGPDHQKEFEVEARLNTNVIGRGKGRSKREAEMNAAKEALKLFSVDPSVDSEKI